LEENNRGGDEWFSPSSSFISLIITLENETAPGAALRKNFRNKEDSDADLTRTWGKMIDDAICSCDNISCLIFI